MKSGSLTYRPEVDGLRAVAIAGVVLFHAGLGVGGGYVGVDVFFVISGFLITSIILKQTRAGTFSFMNFWARRVRRILPASAVVVVMTMLAGLWILPAGDLEELGKSAIAQTVFLANVYFSRQGDYFAGTSDEYALLHTWSLSVEEQFYFVLPVLLVLLHRLRPKLVVPALVVLAVGSLAYSVVGVSARPRSAFFLLPYRAWELLAGSLLAAMGSRVQLRRSIAETISAAGLVAILAAMLLYRRDTPFPGWAALPPVLGAVLFILGNGATTTWAGRAMAWRPIVWVGLISYSLYLVHWPVFSLAHQLNDRASLSVRVALLIVSVLLAWGLRVLVERPFLKRERWAAARWALPTGVAVTSLLLACGAVLVKGHGLPGRFSEATLAMADDVDWYGRDYESHGSEPKRIGVERSADDTQPPDLIVWGDSHAMAFGPTLDRAAQQAGLAGEMYAFHGGIPVPGLWRVDHSPHEVATLDALNESVMRRLAEVKPRHVLLVARWSGYCHGQNAVELAAAPTPMLPIVTDRPPRGDTPVTPETSAASMGRQLQRLAESLADQGTTLWVLQQVPETDYIRPAKQFYMHQRFGFAPNAPASGVTIEDHRQRQALFADALLKVTAENLRCIDPAPGFFAQTGRLVHHSSRSHYRDDDHLTRFGADLYLLPVLQTFMDTVRSDTVAARP